MATIRTSISVAARDLIAGGVRGRSLGGGHGAAYIDVGDVIAVTDRRVPAMPNGIVFEDRAVPDIPAGAIVTLNASGLDAPRVSLRWPEAQPYDSRLARVEPGEWLAARIAALEKALAREHVAADLGHGLGLLQRAVGTLAAGDAAAAAAHLTGQGGGLTPEGDDLLAASAASGFALGAPRAWGRAFVVEDLAHRTTKLSASLLRLAVDGRTIAPMVELFDPGSRKWASSIEELLSLGHSTGRAYLSGSMLVATTMMQRVQDRSKQQREEREACLG